jgi:hypothetical protein
MVLTKLPDHALTIVAAVGFFHCVYTTARVLSKSNLHYSVLPRTKQVAWGMKVTSTFHAILIIVASIPIFFDKTLQNDHIYGYSCNYPLIFRLPCASICDRCGLFYMGYDLFDFKLQRIRIRNGSSWCGMFSSLLFGV